VADARTSRVRRFAFVVALVLALAAAAFLVMSVQANHDAHSALASARVSLRAERAASSTAATQLGAAHHVLDGVGAEVSGVPAAATALAKLDEQDLALIEAALQAGPAGDLGAYNQAVDQRAVIDPEHDTAVEQLRRQANSIITALDQVR
jgi:hypothetical protein